MGCVIVHGPTARVVSCGHNETSEEFNVRTPVQCDGDRVHPVMMFLLMLQMYAPLDYVDFSPSTPHFAHCHEDNQPLVCSSCTGYSTCGTCGHRQHFTSRDGSLHIERMRLVSGADCCSLIACVSLASIVVENEKRLLHNLPHAPIERAGSNTLDFGKSGEQCVSTQVNVL